MSYASILAELRAKRAAVDKKIAELEAAIAAKAAEKGSRDGGDCGGEDECGEKKRGSGY